MKRFSAPPFAVLLAASLGVFPIAAALAQQPTPLAAETDRAARQGDLDAVTKEIGLTADRQAALQKEIDGLAKDRATLNDTLIATGERAQKLEGELDQTELRIKSLAGEERKLRNSLAARREVLSEVLAALQRMGRSPPPAMLVRPEDALDAVRSAILLGAVVPNLKVDADALTIDLKQLASLRADLATERDRLAADAGKLAEEQQRIALLIAEKKKAEVASADALQAARDRAAALAQQAATLKDLIAGMEKEGGAAAKAADDAKRADAARLVAAAAAARAGAKAPPTVSLGAVDRIAPAINFADAKGLLPRPVNGAVLHAFGDDDGAGARTVGVSITTRNGARVSSPADGWVVFSGPFRSYGQLLIINAGGGYHVLLAGMQRSDVELGQFVLAGEPLAVMGDQRVASAGPVAGVSQPVLYVEFRKDGNAVDPGPWWAPANDEKVGG